VHIYHIPHACHKPHRTALLDVVSLITIREDTEQSLVSLFLFGPTSVLKHRQSVFFPSGKTASSYTHIQNRGITVFLYILVFTFLDSRPEDKAFWTALQQAFPEFSMHSASSHELNFDLLVSVPDI
jgi:hypothetical protein